MIDRRTLLSLPLGVSLLAFAPPAFADEPVKVVASFSILGDMAKEIGGDHVAVSTLVGPDADAHVFEPTPADARRIGEARVLVTNGLGFEPWLPRLVETAGFKGETVVASAGVAPIPFGGHDEDAHENHADHDEEHAGAGHRDHGTVDPHAWQDVSNAVLYAQAIAEGLAAADPANAADYRERGAAYASELSELDARVKADLSAVPAANRKVVTSHDAFGYFARAYGILFIAPEGVSTEAEASAADVAKIIDQIRAENISAVFMENITNSRLVEQIASETDARIGGSLYSDALSKEDGPASTYIDMVRNNVAQILAALKTS